MATPIGHYLLGLSITQAVARDHTGRKRGLWLAAVACVPDLDVIPGLFVGNLSRFHHGATHSFAAAALFAVFSWLLLKPVRQSPATLVAVLFLLYASHVVLDFFTLDTGAPFGVPLFWPFSGESYQSSWLLLPNVQHTRAPLVSLHNVGLMARETLIFLPLIALIHTLKRGNVGRLLTPVCLFGGWFILAVWVSGFFVAKP
jgi:membrane-bound metal-dependent hydrolase YbcI (DUF457 family)